MNADETISILRRIEGRDRARRMRFARKQALVAVGKAEGNIRIVYVLTHTQVCGGVKVVFEHANRLVNLGASVTVVAHLPRPDWFPLAAAYVAVPFQYELATGIPPCDVIVATYWDHIHACVERGIAPVVYFEQGDFHLFDWERNNVPAAVHELIRKAYGLPPHIACVSEAVAGIIGEKYGREAAVFPNALNSAVFYPKAVEPTKKYMLIVGSDKVSFKGIADLKKVYSLVRQRGHDIGLVWITPVPPAEPAGEVVVNPPQELIGELYRGACVFVSGSYYEAFSLPPLEAMACGTPVVTAANPGVREYGRDRENCLMTAAGDVAGLADRVAELLEDAGLYASLQRAGYRTAAAYDWEAVAVGLLAFYERVAAFAPTARNSSGEWVKGCAGGDFVNPDDSERLDVFLAQTDADRVLAPVIHDGAEVPTASWEVAARRKKVVGEGNAVKVSWPLKPGRAAGSRPWADIARLYRQGEYEQALRQAQQKLAEAGDRPAQAVCMRWALMCQLRLERDDDALVWAEKAMIAHPLYSDLFYLAAGLMMRRGRDKRAGELTERCRLIGDAAYYPEFFPAVAELAAASAEAARAARGLKILVVSWEPYPHRGGVDTLLKALVGGLRRKGHGVELLSASDLGRLPEAAAEKVRRFIGRLKESFSGKVPKEIIDIEAKRFAFKEMLTLYDESGFDVIHAHNGILNPLLRERYLDTPLVGTVHGCMYSESFHWGNFTRQEAELFREYDRSAVSIPDMVVTVTAVLDKALPPVPAGRHAVVHNGVDAAEFRPCEKANAVLRFVTSGVFTTVKGYDVLMAALMILKGEGLEYELTMFGDGCELPGLHRLAAAHGLPVAFKGRVPREELARRLPRFDVLIQPSRQENFPFSVIEAMAAGCAVVCSRVNGMTEQVTHGRNGLLFTAGNAAELADCLRYAVTHRPEIAAMGRQARKTAEEEFSTAAMVEKYEAVYRQAIAERNETDGRAWG